MWLPRSFPQKQLDCDVLLDVPQVFWHSSAHVLGECMECEYGVKLCVGPPTQDGFYYGDPPCTSVVVSLSCCRVLCPVIAA